jgi:ribose-phosphate pyrophosphokinase
VSVVAPYLCYSRQDRRVEAGDPVANRYQAACLEASGMDAIMTLEVHDPPAFENAYRCEALNLEAASLFGDEIAPSLASAEFAVVSPDAGGLKRTQGLSKALSVKLGRQVPIAVVDKSRIGSNVFAQRLLGDIAGRTAVIYDDMISTGGTIVRAAETCKAAGAIRVIAIATHGLFCGRAMEILSGPLIDQIIVGDTAASARHLSGAISGKVRVVDTTGLISEGILIGVLPEELPQKLSRI